MKKKSIKLSIISIEKKETLDVEWIEIESPTGSFVVGPNHRPLVSIIKEKSSITYKNVSGKEVAQELSGGIVRTGNNEVTIIVGIE